MTDSFDRTIRYLRLSVTDRCDLRCVYCMPEGEGHWLPAHRLLTFDEILRLAALFAAAGVEEVRLTGGEPLLRPELPRLVGALKALPGIRRVALTTNGTALARQLLALYAAGLDGVNISLDTLDPVQYTALTRRDRLPSVLEGLSAALARPRLTVKLNCVPMADNSGQLVPLAALARDRDLSVRFIELMPIGLGRSRAGMTQAEVLAALERAFGPALPCPPPRGAGPSRYLTFSGFRGRVGFISAMSHPFCAGCDRVRLTADGLLKTCLQYDAGVDLKALLEAGADDARLLAAIRDAVRQKPACHHFGDGAQAPDEGRNMNEIGG